MTQNAGPQLSAMQQVRKALLDSGKTPEQVFGAKFGTLYRLIRDPNAKLSYTNLEKLCTCLGLEIVIVNDTEAAMLAQMRSKNNVVDSRRNQK